MITNLILERVARMTPDEIRQIAEETCEAVLLARSARDAERRRKAFHIIRRKSTENVKELSDLSG